MRSFDYFIQLATYLIWTLLTMQHFYSALFLVHTSYSSYCPLSIHPACQYFASVQIWRISAKSHPSSVSVMLMGGVWAGDHIVIFKYLPPAHNKQPYITQADILILPRIITLPSFFSHYHSFQTICEIFIILICLNVLAALDDSVSVRVITPVLSMHRFE